MSAHIQVRILDNNSQNFTGSSGLRGKLHIILSLTLFSKMFISVLLLKVINSTLILLIENELPMSEYFPPKYFGMY